MTLRCLSNTIPPKVLSALVQLQSFVPNQCGKKSSLPVRPQGQVLRQHRSALQRDTNVSAISTLFVVARVVVHFDVKSILCLLRLYDSVILLMAGSGGSD